MCVSGGAKLIKFLATLDVLPQSVWENSDVFGPAYYASHERRYVGTAYRKSRILLSAILQKLSVIHCELLVTHINQLGNFTVQAMLTEH